MAKFDLEERTFRSAQDFHLFGFGPEVLKITSEWDFARLTIQHSLINVQCSMFKPGNTEH